jgi:hypothetical protein
VRVVEAPVSRDTACVRCFGFGPTTIEQLLRDNTSRTSVWSLGVLALPGALPAEVYRLLVVDSR